MEKLLQRYTSLQKETVARFFEKLATVSNKTGKMLESKQVKIIKSWEVFPSSVVIEALGVYLKMEVPQASGGKGKNEKYVLGIMKNIGLAGGGEVGRVDAHGRGTGAECFKGEDEGGRINNIASARNTTANELECDF